MLCVAVESAAYNGVSTSGSSVTIAAAPRGYVAGKADALTTAFNNSEFQLMTTQQINDTISNVIFDGVASDAYTDAVARRLHLVSGRGSKGVTRNRRSKIIKRGIELLNLPRLRTNEGIEKE
jgi:hypothetical protein